MNNSELQYIMISNIHKYIAPKLKKLTRINGPLLAPKSIIEKLNFNNPVSKELRLWQGAL